MLASSIITLVAFPLYSLGYHWYGATGLALASDAGIALQTISLAVLLHQRRWSRCQPGYVEMGRCLVAAGAGGLTVGVVFGWLGDVLHKAVPGQTRGIDLAVLVAGTAVWVAIVKWVLEETGSALPRVTKKRLGDCAERFPVRGRILGPSNYMKFCLCYYGRSVCRHSYSVAKNTSAPADTRALVEVDTMTRLYLNRLGRFGVAERRSMEPMAWLRPCGCRCRL